MTPPCLLSFSGRVAVSTFWLAVAAFLSPYPAVGLLAPLLLLLRRAFRHKVGLRGQKSFVFGRQSTNHSTLC